MSDQSTKRISLATIPKDEKTFKLCMTAVRHDGLELCHVPKRFRQENLCKTAVYQNAMAVQFVPENVIANSDMLSFACSRHAWVFNWAKQYWPGYVDYDVSMASVKAHGLNIKYVDESLVDLDMALLAVQNDGRSFNCLPDRFKTKELISSICIKFLPDNLKTYEACMRDIGMQGRMIKYVPVHFIDEDMVNLALSKNPWALEFVPVTFYDLDSYRESLEQLRELDASPDFVEELMVV